MAATEEEYIVEFSNGISVIVQAVSYGTAQKAAIAELNKEIISIKRVDMIKPKED